MDQVNYQAGQRREKLIIKINYDKKVHDQELQVMFRLKYHQINGLPEIIDHGEVRNAQASIGVKESKVYYFMAMKKLGISLK